MIADGWAHAESWVKLLDLNRAYLRDETNMTLFYLGPIHDETRHMLPGPLRLHDFGLLTFESQPSNEQTTCEVLADSCPEITYWARFKQRAFLSFLLPQDDLMDKKDRAAFLAALSSHDKLYVSVCTLEAEDDSGTIMPGWQATDNFPKDWQTHTLVTLRVGLVTGTRLPC